MGVGKTAVGRELARLLRLEFIDTDAQIEQSTGVDIGFIFEKEGEAGFRQRETAMLATTLSTHAGIIATGGGIVLAAENRRLIAANGIVVHLTATLDTQLRRTAHTRGRPLLEARNKRETLRRINAERATLYDSIANITIATDAHTPQTVARKIKRATEAR